ncbi:AsmA-like C-terminal region [Saccharicrinis carchari]|uniref:AsmA-like C-terminal region n=1 Tax=Saccharicrinis carchari TaxID=1168039 RepID=A0A521B374_SACCC|nr:AsmA-like C-terminal region-containing protein [Saccharicrinis carchari]SMO41538.1 AsmA-like C-terminal region [Saccharicrinis carchari]
MKNILKITGGVLLFIFLLLLVTPLFFKGKAEELAKREINKQVMAQVDWDSFSISLFKHFPNISVGMSGLRVVGLDKFEKDTLLFLNEFVLSADLMSAIRGNLSVEHVLLDKPVVLAKVLADSTANWDIMRQTDELTEPEDISTTGSDFTIDLQSVKVRDATITYLDQTMDLLTDIQKLNLSMSGDLSASASTLSTEASIEELTLSMEGTNFLNKVKVSLIADIMADMNNMVFTFADNDLMLNDLNLGFDGSVGMPEEGYDLDIKLSAKETSFKQLLSIVPKEFLADMEGVQTQGVMALAAKAKGRYMDTDMLPAFSAMLKIDKGQIKYPDLPESINDININVVVDNPGGSADNTITDIKTFHFELGSNPFDASLLLKTPVSNLQFKGGMVGVIDLGSLKDAMPLDSFDIKGIVDANITLDGDMEMMEKENYDQVQVKGSLKLHDFLYSSPDLPKVNIGEAQMSLTPQRIALDKFVSRVGKSDFDLSGHIENYLPYIFKDETVKGSLKHRSNRLDVNEMLLSMGSTETAEVADSTTMELFEVPKNIDFVFTSHFGTILYDKLRIDNTNGKITVRDGRVVLNGIAMRLLNGEMKMAGEYNTQDVKKPFVDFNFDAANIDINKTAHSFSVIDSLMPIAKKTVGNISADFKFNSLLGPEMDPVISSITGGGTLVSESVEVADSKVLNSMANLLKKEKYRKLKAEDLNINFVMKDGKIIVEPFTAKVFGSTIKVHGEQGFDQSLNYVVTAPVARKDVAGALSFLGGGISESGDDIMVDVLIKGYAADPKLSLDLSEAKKEVGKEIEKKAKEAVKDILKDDKVKNAIEGLFKKKK